MIKLYDKTSGALVGEISEEQLQSLMDNLEEESASDDDYYLNRDTLEILRQAGASDELLDILANAMGETGELEIRWSRE
jgi:hypothetical protein